MVVLDKLRKYAYFIGLTHPHANLELIRAHFDNVFKHHG